MPDIDNKFFTETISPGPNGFKIVIIEEPDFEEKISIETLKKISGGDKMTSEQPKN